MATTPLQLLLLAALLSGARAALAGIGALSDFHVYQQTIGPVAEQYNGTRFACSSFGKNASACISAAAAYCESLGWCRSFAVMDGGGRGEDVQIYHADYNESLSGHPRWTLYARGTAPPAPPAPPTPPPTPTLAVSYCQLKALTQRYVRQLMPRSALAEDAVYAALQLGPLCNQAPPSPPAAPPAGAAAAAAGAGAGAGAGVAAAAAGGGGGGLRVFVDAARGDDGADGGAETPVASLQRALALTRAGGRRAAAGATATITVGAGTYYLNETLRLGPADSNLRIAGADSAARGAGADADVAAGAAVVSAGVPLPSDLAWRPAREAAPDARVAAGVLVATLPASLDLGPSGDFDTLFAGGRRAVRARFPNARPETQGLWTPDTGYLPPSAAKVVGGFKQKCVGAVSCSLPNETVPGFIYGEYSGASDLTAGYEPAFEPYWCGKWSGIRGLQLDAASGALNGSALSRWNASRLAGGRAVLHMTRGAGDIWSNFQWRVAGFHAGNTTLALGAGGYQFPRGASGSGWFWVDNVLEELDAPLEWYFDKPTRRLFFLPNATGGAGRGGARVPALVAARLRTVIAAAGDGDGGGGGERIANVSLSGLRFAHTATTYLAPYETPSGGGYSVHRGAAVSFANATGVEVRGCTFDSPGGNGLLLSEHVRRAAVRGNDFVWVGDSAVVLLGRARLCDATAGTQPRGTQVAGNLMREVGVWGKQGAGLFQALAMETNVSGNVIFNGPRAGVLFNDGMGGGNTVAGNALFNLVRETTDHGPFNSWDRVPYVTRAADGRARVGPALSNITRNLVMCNYQCTWPIDHDDGSNGYNDTFNVLLYGGAKNFKGHDKSSRGNLYVYPDAKPTEGPFGQGVHKDFCANNDGATARGGGFAGSGFNETWARNRCIIARPTSTYLYDNCDPSSAASLAATSDRSYRNVFYLHDPAALRFRCAKQTWSLAEAQARGWDAGSGAQPLPTADEIVAWSQALLGM
eukprot:g7160.t1